MIKFKMSGNLHELRSTAASIKTSEFKYKPRNNMFIIHRAGKFRKNNIKHKEKHKSQTQFGLVCDAGVVRWAVWWGFSPRRAGTLGEVGGEEAERLALVGGQGGTVALEVARDAATGGTRTVTQSLDAALPLQLYRERDTDTERYNVELEPSDKVFYNTSS